MKTSATETCARRCRRSSPLVSLPPSLIAALPLISLAADSDRAAGMMIKTVTAVSDGVAPHRIGSHNGFVRESNGQDGGRTRCQTVPLPTAVSDGAGRSLFCQSFCADEEWGALVLGVNR